MEKLAKRKQKEKNDESEIAKVEKNTGSDKIHQKADLMKW